MEINTTYPKPNAAVSQLPSRSQNTATPNSEQPGAADTISFSSASQRLAQSAGAASLDSQPGIANREQAQQVVGQLISGISSNPGQALSTYGNVSRSSVGALLS